MEFIKRRDLDADADASFQPQRMSRSSDSSTRAFSFDIPDDPDVRIPTDHTRLTDGKSDRALGKRNLRVLEQRVEELEKRLEIQEVQNRDLSDLLSQSHSHQLVESKAAPRDNDQLIEFFLTEMEKYQTMSSKLSVAHTKLQQELHDHRQQMQHFQSDQTLRMKKYLEIMRRMEKEFVHGEKLRDEEKRLALAQHKKRIELVTALVEEQLANVRQDEELQRNELQDRLEKKFIDVVMENQVLKTENMELRGDLQQVSALARSNKKTIRMLTEEILKIKRTAVVYPTENDELLAFRSVFADAYNAEPLSTTPMKLAEAHCSCE